MRRLGAEIRTPHPRHGRRKFAASLGPEPACPKSGACQGARRPRRRRPRQRPCLLKGCEKPFRSTHPQARYCSAKCQAAARRWRRRRASRQYRQTANGRLKRQAQCQRYRCRCTERRQRDQAQQSPAPESPCTCPTSVREGQRPAGDSEFFRCERPGCEAWFIRTSRSPCQRFCSPSCRQALRRVIERERRWRQRGLRARRQSTTKKSRGP